MRYCDLPPSGPFVSPILCAAAFFALVAAAGSVGAADAPELSFTLTAGKDGFISSARFSKDTKTVLTTGLKPSVGVWDAKNGKAIKSVEVPGNGFAVDLSSDGSRAVGIGAGSALLVWDLEASRQLAELKLKGHTDAVLFARLSPDATQVATASRDKTARLWDAKTGKLVVTLTGHKGPVASAQFSPDGTRVATGSYFAEIKIWDTAKGELQLDLTGMSTSNNPTVFSTDGKLVVSPRHESPMVWELKDGKEVRELKGHQGWCRTAAFDRTADRVVTAGLDKTARVWDVKTGKVLHTLKHDGEVSTAEFSADGSSVLTVCSGKAHVWQLPAGK